MLERSIRVFDNKAELLIKEIVITPDFNTLSKKYKDEIGDDPLLIYEYEIKNEDVEFYKKIVDIDFEFDKYSYFLLDTSIFII